MSIFTTLNKHLSVKLLTNKLCFYQRISMIVVTIFALTILLFLLLSDYLHEQKHIESTHLANQRMAHSVVSSNDIYTGDSIDKDKLISP